MVFRRDLLQVLLDGPRSVSSLARELGLSRRDTDQELQHLLRSAQAAGHHVVIVPACCRNCGFTFDDQKLRKPGKCPACRHTRIYEAQIRIESAADEPAPR